MLLVATIPQAAWADTVTIGASRDSTIYQNATSSSGGGAAGIFSGTTGTGSPRRGLIAFDVAGNLPAGASITAAELTLYVGSAPSGSAVPIGLHQLTADWGEGTAGSSSTSVGGGGGGFPAADGDATWNARFHSTTSPVLWSTAGGDFDPVATATASVASTLNIPSVWMSTAALVGDVQQWLDNPASNFGWALVNGNEAGNSTVRAFYSSEAALNSASQPLDPAWRPALSVTYVVPEPTSTVLLLIGLALLAASAARRGKFLGR
jgi:hypothetical protein